MTRGELIDSVKTLMPPHLYQKAGAILITGIDTLKPANAYVMGLNPGGHPKKLHKTIIDTIAPPDGTSCYTHECWQPACTEVQPCRHLDKNGTTRPEFLVRHQRNMISLASALDATPATLFSANAVFGRSTKRATLREQTSLGLAEWWEACWPVHQRFLAIVRPRILVTLGYGETSSAFGLLRDKAGSPRIAQLSDEGRRSGWMFETTLELARKEYLETVVVGVPHPSYFAVGPQLASALSNLIRLQKPN